MKRDLVLIRKILFALEAMPDGDFISSQDTEFDGWSETEVSYNLAILLDAEYIKGSANFSENKRLVLASRLTWAGHEFLDAARDDTHWNKVVSFSERAGGIAFAVIKPILTDLATSSVRSAFGFPPA